MESIDITSDYLQSVGCTIKKEGSTVSIEFNNDSHPKRFQIYKDWNKTTKQIEKKLEEKLFLSDLSKALRKGFHSCFSSDITIRNEGTILPILDNDGLC